MAAEKLKRELGFRDVVLFYIVSGLSLRWIATAAASGQSAIVGWILAWCIPLASLGLFSTMAAIVLALFPAEDERNPAAALFKIVAMTCVLLVAGLAVYRRGQRSIDRAAAQGLSTNLT
jgi:hypothetical protein